MRHIWSPTFDPAFFQAGSCWAASSAMFTIHSINPLSLSLSLYIYIYICMLNGRYSNSMGIRHSTVRILFIQASHLSEDGKRTRVWKARSAFHARVSYEVDQILCAEKLGLNYNQYSIRSFLRTTTYLTCQELISTRAVCRQTTIGAMAIELLRLPDVPFPVYNVRYVGWAYLMSQGSWLGTPWHGSGLPFGSLS